MDTAIKFNKYHFDNIVLIHNQNPNAEFLATIDIWNNNVGRQVNKGTKGLAVLELDNPIPTYKHLFELKNTNGTYASYKKVLDYNWKVNEEDKNNIIKNINKNLGTNFKSLKEFLYNKMISKIDENYETYFENISLSQDALSSASNISLLMTEYMILKKCNYEIDLPKDINFDIIKDIKLFSKIGSLATDITRDVLKDVFIQVKKL